MIKELCKTLKERLEFQNGIPFLDVYAGLVQTVTYQDQDENNNNLTKRMPVSYHTNIEDCVNKSPEKALIPDSSKKGIIYFEENGGAYQSKRMAGGLTMWKAQLICVAWLNRRLITGDDYDEIVSRARSTIMAKLKSQDITSPFVKIFVNNTRIRQTPDIFAKYTYDETILQYLRPPFEYFALDLDVTFIIKGECLPTIEINPNNC